jgi:hypothetical protein
VTVDGVTYGDWYLPSKYELNLLYLQKNMIGSLGSVHYWSSAEDYISDAWKREFTDGSQDHMGKMAPNGVRAIRSF